MFLRSIFLLSVLVALSSASLAGYCMPYYEGGCSWDASVVATCNCLPENFETCVPFANNNSSSGQQGYCHMTAMTWAILVVGTVAILAIFVTIFVLIAIFCCGCCMCCACSACCKKANKSYKAVPQDFHDDGWQSDNSRY